MNQQMDLSTLALLISGLGTLLTLGLQALQAGASKSSESGRIKIDSDRVQLDKFVQSASAVQIIQTTAANMVDQMRMQKTEAEAARDTALIATNAAVTKLRQAAALITPLLDVLDQQVLLFDTKGGDTRCQTCVFAREDFRKLTGTIRITLNLT